MVAIIDFQRQNGLKPDGVIGKVTLAKIKQECNISNDVQLAHFVGQCHHETGGFMASVENLNYSAQGLLRTFAKYFPTNALATMYARKPEMIANRVYASRMGNGNEASGDGWKYRGRGAIQLTGKNNYQAFANYVKDQSIMDNPDLVATKYFFKSADFFFDNNKLWDICRNDISDKTIQALTRRINGGFKGLEDRIVQTKKYYLILTS
jgi:putative chitinase